MMYALFGIALVAAAVAACTPAVAALWRDSVEKRDRAFAEELLTGAAKPASLLEKMERGMSRRSTTRRSKDKFEEQLAAALPMIAKNMQAGHMFEQSAKTVSEFMEQPLRGQFAQLAAERRVGMSLEQSMNNLSQRTGSRDARMLAAAVAVQAESGGAIADTIESIGAAMRRRAKIRRHVRSLTASYRMSSRIVSAIPLVLVVILSVMSRENVVLLFTNPIGQLALLVAAALDVAGVLVIRKLYQIDIY